MRRITTLLALPLVAASFAFPATAAEGANDVAVGAQGNAYVTGETRSSDTSFPVTVSRVLEKVLVSSMSRRSEA